MQTIVFASSILSSRIDASRRDERDLERFYAAPRQGLRDVARVMAAIGGIAAYAGLLAIAWN